MTLSEAIKIGHQYQSWRKGKHDDPPEIKDITECLEMLIKNAEEMLKEIESWNGK